MKKLIYLFLFVFPLSLLAQDRIGFFSGTFDPPHLGHKDAVIRAIKHLQLDSIYVVPNLTPAHKPNATSYQARLEMTRLMMKDVEQAILPDEELEKTLGSGGVDAVLLAIELQHPNAMVISVMGEDAPARYPDAIYERMEAGVLLAVNPREDSGEKIPDRILNHPGFTYLPPPQFTTSSTQIRKDLSEGRVPKEVPPEILTVIDRHKLYGSPGNLCQRLLKAD